ncbi:MAG: polynucleotide adenylyltransferase PcnB [Gammaproteobacteria bacterium]|nr:polynucleotide adenylyltransferase PcnB [Gammaproteobacteria bacterium]
MKLISFWQRITRNRKNKAHPLEQDVNNSAPKIIHRKEHALSRKDISEHALKVLYRLKKASYEGFLVGGGVRDLLLGLHPKDFDVATNATPEQVRKLFGNCRLIGRRFRLAHVHFGRDIIEVATFRTSHDQAGSDQNSGDGVTKDGMIVRDNVFGSLEDDAWRRDFTVNALYYNIYDFSIVDYTGGLKDIENKNIRIIGDADERLQEDPVRMLRAVRFAAKLNFKIEDSLSASIKANIHLLDGVPTARLFEEVLKLFLHGHALASYELLKEYDLLKHLFRQTADNLDDTGDRFITQALINTDVRIKQNKPIAPAFLYAALLWPAVKAEMDELKYEDLSLLQVYQIAGQNVLENQLKQILIPKRFGIPMREIWTMQARLASRKGKRPLKLLPVPRFRASYDFLLLREQSGETQLKELCEWWTDIQQVSEEEQLTMCKKVTMGGHKKGKRPPKKKKLKIVKENG